MKAVVLPAWKLCMCICLSWHFKSPLRSHLKNKDVWMFLCFVHLSLYCFNFRSSRSCLQQQHSFASHQSVVSEHTAVWSVSHVITTDLFSSNSKAVSSTSQRSNSVSKLEKSDRASEFYQALHSSLAAVRAEFAESSCCK